MLRRTVILTPLVAAFLLLPACSKPDPQKALEIAVQQLQDHLEAKDTQAVLSMLDARFRAQDEHDAEWARKTMSLMFLRYANVKVFAVTRSSRIDPPGSSIGITEAQVVFTGAQELVPERATPYSVQLQWTFDGADWKLRDIRWR